MNREQRIAELMAEGLSPRSAKQKARREERRGTVATARIEIAETIVGPIEPAQIHELVPAGPVADDGPQESRAGEAVAELETLPPAETFTAAAPLAVGDNVQLISGEIAPILTVDPVSELETASGRLLKKRQNITVDPVFAANLYRQGKKVIEIAAAAGFRPHSGQDKVRAALRIAGVYVKPGTGKRPAAETEAVPATQPVLF